jgi:hypothetical protein
MYNSKQAKSDLAQVKEQLRNAASRAPMVSVTNIRTYISSSSNTISTGSAGAVATPESAGVDVVNAFPMQGPDPAPPSYIDSSADSTGEEDKSDTVRISTGTSIAIVPNNITTSSEENIANDDFANNTVATSTAVANTIPEGEVEQPISSSTISNTTAREDYIRIEIVSDDSDVEDVPIHSSCSSSTTSNVPSAASSASTTVTSSDTKPKKTKKKSAPSSTKKSKSASATASSSGSAIRGPYDLERALLSASHSADMQMSILLSTSSRLSQIFQSVLEPATLELVLSTIAKYLGTTASNIVDTRVQEVLQHLEELAAVRDFTLLFALLDSRCVDQLQAALRTAVTLYPTFADRLSKPYKL